MTKGLFILVILVGLSSCSFNQENEQKLGTPDSVSAIVPTTIQVDTIEIWDSLVF